MNEHQGEPSLGLTCFAIAQILLKAVAADLIQNLCEVPDPG